MSRVDGIGGVFLRANDVKALVAWYEQYLGLSFRCFEADENYGLELFSRAVAGSASAQQTAVVVGPALGGLIYAAGPATVYGICAGVFSGIW